MPIAPCTASRFLIFTSGLPDTLHRECLKFHTPPGWRMSSRDIDALDISGLLSFPIDDLVAAYSQEINKVRGQKNSSRSVDSLILTPHLLKEPCHSHFFPLTLYHIFLYMNMMYLAPRVYKSVWQRHSFVAPRLRGRSFLWRASVCNCEILLLAHRRLALCRM